MICFLFQQNTSAQIPAVVREWAVYAGNTTDSSFKIPVIILDGDAIVATFTLDSISGPDIKIIRYGGESVEGDVKWETTWTGSGNGRDVPTGLYIFDNAIYVCGISWTSTGNYDYVTLKLDDQGGVLWSQTYNGTASGYDVASALAVSNTGVFVTGTANNTGTSLDFTTICYDKDNGSQLWIAHHDYQSLMDIPFSLQLEGSNVIVVGACQETLQAWEYQGIIYEDNGDYYDSYNSSGSSSGFDRALAVCADSSGNVYITGAISTANEGFNIKTVKIEPGGHVAWEVEHDQSGGDDTGFDVIVDEDQNVYVCGSVSNHVNGSSDDFYLTKYTVNGQKDWDVLIDRENDVDIARALCMDSYGNIIVTGESYREDEQNMIFRPDFLTVGFTQTGEEIWRDYFGAVDKNDQATDIAADLNGNVYVTGNIGEDQDIQTVTIRYRTDYYTEPVTTEPASANFAYYENTGQLIDTEGGSPDYIHYYMPNHSPMLFFQKTNINLVWASGSQDTTTQDSLFRVDMFFDQSEYNEKPAMLTENDSSNYINYYLGHCPEGITAYANEKLLYSEIYPGIDLVFSSNAAGMKMYFICEPGSDPSNIGLSFTGMDSLSIVNNWSLRLETLLGNYDFERPRVYQQDQNGNVSTLPWQLNWTLENDSIGRFTNWGTYNTELKLVIEVGKSIQTNGNTPIYNLEWSTYRGSIYYDFGYQMVSDDVGDFYSLGTSSSPHFPNVDGLSLFSINQGQDLIITKYSYIGTTGLNRNVDWCTYFGGGDIEIAGGIAVSGNGSIYITGSTASTNFPIEPLLGGNFNYANLNRQSSGVNLNMDAFILKLRNDGLRNLWSSYIGGNGWEDGRSIKINNNGEVYIVGNTNSDGTILSPQFPLTSYSNGFNQNVYGGTGSSIQMGDGFIIKFSAGDQVLWSTFFGGSEGDKISDLAVIDNNRIALVGITESAVANNPSTGMPCLAANNGKFPDCDPGNGYYVGSYNGGSSDCFISIFNSDNQLEWSTYFGGTDSEYLEANSISSSINTSGKYFITGATSSTSAFPIQASGSYNQSYAGGNSDLFIAEFNGFTRSWCTYLGGGGHENPGSITNDLYGRIFLSGTTTSSSTISTCTPPSNVTDFPICNSSGQLYSSATFNGIIEPIM